MSGNASVSRGALRVLVEKAARSKNNNHGYVSRQITSISNPSITGNRIQHRRRYHRRTQTLLRRQSSRGRRNPILEQFRHVASLPNIPVASSRTIMNRSGRALSTTSSSSTRLGDNNITQTSAHVQAVEAITIQNGTIKNSFERNQQSHGGSFRSFRNDMKYVGAAGVVGTAAIALGSRTSDENTTNFDDKSNDTTTIHNPSASAPQSYQQLLESMIPSFESLGIKSVKSSESMNRVALPFEESLFPYTAKDKTLCDADDTSDDLLSTSTTAAMDHPSLASKPRNVMIHRKRSIRGRSLFDKYKIYWDTVLGEGAYGSVHPARLKVTGEKVALKKICRNYTSASGFKTETDALLRLYDNGGHPNISGLRDMYEDHNFYYLILDLVSGGEMFDHLIKYGAYSEADAARLIHEIASALAFLHGVGIVHMDLKPENLLLSTKNRLDGTIKIIDFGGAYIFDEDTLTADNGQDGSNQSISTNKTQLVSRNTAKPSTSDEKCQQLFTSTGTTAYWSPERFTPPENAGDDVDLTRIAPAFDMWSVGVILYIMLTGVHPFDVKGRLTDEEIEKQIVANPYPPMSPDLVGHLSDSAIDLIKKLMEKDPLKRLSAYEMLHHPWVRGETASREKMQDSDKKLSQFTHIRHQVETKMFEFLVGGAYSDATISEAKIRSSVNGSHSKGLVANKDVDKNALSADEDDDEIHRKSATNILQRAFAVFDAEGKGYITPDDLGRITGVSPQSAKEYIESTNPDHHNDDSEDVSSKSYLSLSQFNNLFSGLHHKHYPRGHYIFHAGDTGDAMYFLSSGKVEIQTRKGQLVAILRSGDFFGEGSLLDSANSRFTSAKCATPVDVIEIKRADFDRYIGSSAIAKRDIQVKWRARSLAYAKNLLRLQKNVLVRTFKKGDVVYREGDIGTSMYRVDDENGGELEVSHNGTVVHKYGAGDSFGESSLLFKRPRSSTVICSSEKCRLHEMKGEDFLAAIESSPEMAESLRNMARKRLFKKAVKAYSLEQNRGFSDEDIVQAFHDADVDRSGSLNLHEVRWLMHKMDPKFPLEEIKELLKFVDVDEDGQINVKEFKSLFRQFDEVKKEVKVKKSEARKANEETEETKSH